MPYGIESFFWIKLILMIAVMIGFILLFGALMRRVLKVKRKKGFLVQYTNELHKKLDFVIRGFAVFLIIVGGFYNIVRLPLEPIWILQPFFLLPILVILTELFRAFMEWKYAENKNDYKYTLASLAFVIVIGASTLYIGFIIL